MKNHCVILAAHVTLAASLLGVTTPAGQSVFDLPAISGGGSWTTLGAKTGKLEASLASGGSLKGKAAYTEEALKNGRIRQKISIEIQGAIPGVNLEVSVKGTKLGVVTADAFGRAKLELKAGGDDPGSVKSLPFLVAGDSATVGGASGKFVTR